MGKGRYGRFGYPYYLKNKFGVNKFHKYIDRIVTYSDHRRIFGIQTINICNGIDMSKIEKRKVLPKTDFKEIRFIGVAQVRMWHGYDRFIEGLHIYYRNGGKRKIIFHIVGDIIDTYHYQEKIREYHLENNVVLWGRKSGKELDDLYEQSDIGIDALAGHRAGLTKSCSLKTREYFAKGLPFISSVRIKDIPKNFPYVRYFPHGEEPVDIQKAVDFYDSVYKQERDFQKVNEELRSYAERKFQWKHTLQPVVEYINKS